MDSESSGFSNSKLLEKYIQIIDYLKNMVFWHWLLENDKPAKKKLKKENVYVFNPVCEIDFDNEIFCFNFLQRHHAWRSIEELLLEQSDYKSAFVLWKEKGEYTHVENTLNRKHKYNEEVGKFHGDSQIESIHVTGMEDDIEDFKLSTPRHRR